MKNLEKTLQILDKLRENCPHDKTFDIPDLIEHLKEEIFEVEDAIENIDMENIKEEAGDVLFTVLYILKVINEKYGITYDDILKRLNKKMIFRHPHVFENPREVSYEQAVKIWKDQKKLEKKLNIYD